VAEPAAVAAAATSAAAVAPVSHAHGRSPIALYLMMGDALVAVDCVPAGSLCAVAGLDAFPSIAKCGTLVAKAPWAPLAPPFKALAMQVNTNATIARRRVVQRGLGE